MPDEITITSPTELVDHLDQLRQIRDAAKITKKRQDVINAACLDYIMENELQGQVLTIETTSGTHEARLVLGQRSSGFDLEQISAKDINWLKQHQAISIIAGALKNLQGGAVDRAKDVQQFGETKTITFTELKG
jgi:hypothetical protein